MRKRSAFVAGFVGLLTVALTLPLLAASVDPIHIRGAAAKSCQELADQYAPSGTIWHELKVTPPSTSGSDGTLSVTVEYLSSTSFNWDADAEGPAVDAVFVKSGSQGSNLYVYPSQSYGDTDLSTPGTQAISHILFCYTGIPANNPPVANDDEYSVQQDTTLTVVAPGVLGNDTDDDGDALTSSLVSGPANGTVLLDSDGGFTYTPDAGFTGSDSFSYTANDGTDDSNVATASIDVTPALFCDENVTFEGVGEPTYTVRPENGGAVCIKDITYDAGLRGEGGDEQFVELATSGFGQVVFLEKIEFMPFDGSSQISQQLYYDDTLVSQNDPTLAQFCLLDPRVGAGTDNPAFDLHDDYDSAAEAGDVLPAGETTCIISADFRITGSDGGSSLVTPVYYLFNFDDGFRTFK